MHSIIKDVGNVEDESIEDYKIETQANGRKVMIVKRAAHPRKLGSSVKMWLVDTGCGYDLVPLKEVAHLASRFKHVKEKVPFAIAAGETDASHVLKTTVGATGEEMPCYVMDSDDCPAVMSVGRRCMAEGYLFIWPPGRAPFFASPSQSHIVILEIEGLIPYMNDKTQTPSKTGSGCPRTMALTLATVSSAWTCFMRNAIGHRTHDYMQ